MAHDYNCTAEMHSRCSNNQGLEFVVVDTFRKNGNKVCHVRFIESGYETTAYWPSVLRGSIKDRLAPTIHGVASIGYATMSDNKKEYDLWKRLIDKCYGENTSHYERYGAKGVSVCKRWFRFDYFLEDLPKIDGYDRDAFLSGKLHLDKDYKQQGLPHNKKVYSLDTCTFLSPKENQSYRDLEKANKEKEVSFFAMDMDGRMYFQSGYYNFAKTHGLNPTAISACLTRSYEQTDGWVFGRTEKEVRTRFESFKLKRTYINNTISLLLKEEMRIVDIATLTGFSAKNLSEWKKKAKQGRQLKYNQVLMPDELNGDVLDGKWL